jgi:pyruvate dehydrogenase E1 component beta subunit
VLTEVDMTSETTTPTVPDATDEPAAGIGTMTYREAMREAIREAMTNDDRVFLMGEDVGDYGGCFAVSLGLLEEFGPERIRDTPLSESASSVPASAPRSSACDRSSRS